MCIENRSFSVSYRSLLAAAWMAAAAALQCGEPASAQSPGPSKVERFTFAAGGTWTTSMSDDGSVIVGQPGGSPGAFRWTAATGAVRIPMCPNGEYPIVSSDGTAVYGFAWNDAASVYTLARWTEAGGVVPLANVSLPTDAYLLRATADAVVGAAVDPNTQRWSPLRWTSANGLEFLTLPGQLRLANGSLPIWNPDGTAMACDAEWYPDPYHVSFRACIWRASSGWTLLEQGPSPTAISADGSTVAGYMQVANGSWHGFVWSGDGMHDLGEGLRIDAVAPDGAAVVGTRWSDDAAMRWSRCGADCWMPTSFGNFGLFANNRWHWTADASAVVGIGWAGEEFLFRWRPGAELEVLAWAGQGLYFDLNVHTTRSGSVAVGRRLDDFTLWSEELRLVAATDPAIELGSLDAAYINEISANDDGQSVAVIAEGELFHVDGTGLVTPIPSPWGGGVSSARLSADGNTIVSMAADDSGDLGVFRWTPGAGTQVLPFVDSNVWVSADCAVVLGHISNGEYWILARWVASVGAAELGLGATYANHIFMSADGAVVAVSGLSGESYPWDRVLVWTATTGLQDLGQGLAFAVSADGSTVIGSRLSANSTWTVFRWTQASGMQDLFDDDGDALFVSDDGSVVVSGSRRWSQATGVVAMGGQASCMSDDGIAAGSSFGDDGAPHPWVGPHPAPAPPVESVAKHTGECIALAAGGRYALVTGPGRWDAQSASAYFFSPDMNDGDIWASHLSLDGSIVVCASYEYDVALGGSSALYRATFPLAPTVELASATASTCAATNGAIDITVSGADAIAWTGPYGFTSSSIDISGLAPGDYMVVATGPGGSTALSVVVEAATDSTAPVVVSVSPVSIAAGASCTAAAPNVRTAVVASDDCTPSVFLYRFQDPPPGAALALGANQITVHLEDFSGNFTTATVTVTVTGTPSTYYADADHDGAGDPASPLVACGPTAGYVQNSSDGCPADPAKASAGVCGCGVADHDSDGDGRMDCVDIALAMQALSETVPPSGPYAVRVSSVASSPIVTMTGVQMAVRFDATRLSFVDAVPVAGGPFSFELVQSASSTLGTLRYALGVSESQSGMTGGAALVDLVFEAKPGADLCASDVRLVWFQAIGAFTTKFARADGLSVSNLELTGLESVDLDVAAPVISGVPASAVIAADAGSTYGGFVAAPSVTASDACVASLVPTLLVTYPNGSTASAWPADGMFPIGVTTLRWSASDPAGHLTELTRTIQVGDYQLLDLSVRTGSPQLGASVRLLRVKTATAATMVAVPMAAWSGATPSVAAVAGIHVPVAASHACIEFKDTVHSVTAVDADGVSVSGRRYVADCTLVQGDSDGDDIVDVSDFGVFVVDRSTAANPSRAPDARSNFNGDGFVNNADVAVIVANFFALGDSCGRPRRAPAALADQREGTPPLGPRRTRGGRRERRRMARHARHRDVPAGRRCRREARPAPAGERRRAVVSRARVRKGACLCTSRDAGTCMQPARRGPRRAWLRASCLRSPLWRDPRARSMSMSSEACRMSLPSLLTPAAMEACSSEPARAMRSDGRRLAARRISACRRAACRQARRM